MEGNDFDSDGVEVGPALAFSLQSIVAGIMSRRGLCTQLPDCKIRYEIWHELSLRARLSLIKRYVQVSLSVMCPGVELWEMSELRRGEVKATVEFV